MSVESASLIKDTEVWRVLIPRDEEGRFEKPTLQHGVVTGGGPRMVVITWDEIRRPEWCSRNLMAYRVSESPEAAWRHAGDKLEPAFKKAREALQALALAVLTCGAEAQAAGERASRAARARASRAKEGN